MNVLCVDVGNTRTHIGVVREGHVLWEVAVPTPQVTDPKAGLARYLEELKNGPYAPEGIAFCSVVPKATALVQPLLLGTGWPLFHLTWDRCASLGLPIEYPRPEQIGQDRLALALGVLAYYGTPAVAIDLGTAVTFDVINRQGAYMGGVIAPGLTMLTRSLHEQTALLPELDPGDLQVSVNIGSSTIEAMKIGCATGFGGMIRAILDRVLGELRLRGEGAVRIVVTGGNAGQLPQDWAKEIEFDPHLLLRGLEEAWRRNERQRAKG